PVWQSMRLRPYTASMSATRDVPLGMTRWMGWSKHPLKYARSSVGFLEILVLRLRSRRQVVKFDHPFTSSPPSLLLRGEPSGSYLLELRGQQLIVWHQTI